MLLAYIDEIGEKGAFVSRDHPRYNTSPAFGYAGFVIQSGAAREFGRQMTELKRQLFAAELVDVEHPGRWERKGARIFRPNTLDEYDNQIRAINGLIRQLRNHGGWLFYYADEKPVGTPKQTQLDMNERETWAMRETLNRIARHADTCRSNVLVMIDQINETERAARLPNMYGHILGRAAEFPEMRRIIEPPMHVDSELSACIQFADWIAACVTRAIDYQLLEDSPYKWVTTCQELSHVRGAFTRESKLHLFNRSIADLHHSDIYRPWRALYPTVEGQRISDRNRERLQRVKFAAEAAEARQRQSVAVKAE